MLGLIKGLVSDAAAPLIHSATDFAARLIRKIVLFAVAGVCLIVVLIALTIAFDLWIATLAGPIVAALAVAALYLVVAVVAVVLALREVPPQPAAVAGATADPAAEARNPETDARIDQFAAPILDLLQRLGLQREQLAVFAGASVAKRLGPLPLVGCAVVVGFLVGRMWKSWRHVRDMLLAASPLLAEFLRSAGSQPEPPAAPPTGA